MTKVESAPEALSTRSIHPANSIEVPTTPFILSLVAGVFILLGAFMPLVFMGGFGIMGTMMEEYGSPRALDTSYMLSRIVGLTFGGAVLYGAMMLNSRTKQNGASSFSSSRR